jgi:hypothetical protein
MTAALSQPDLFAGFVLADIAPVPYSHSHIATAMSVRLNLCEH